MSNVCQHQRRVAKVVVASPGTHSHTHTHHPSSSVGDLLSLIFIMSHACTDFDSGCGRGCGSGYQGPRSEAWTPTKILRAGASWPRSFGPTVFNILIGRMNTANSESKCSMGDAMLTSFNFDPKTRVQSPILCTIRERGMWKIYRNFIDLKSSA